MGWFGLSNPPLYTCELCGYFIDPKSTNAIRLVLGWVRGNTKTLASIEQENYRYRHETCVGKAEREQQETLF